MTIGPKITLLKLGECGAWCVGFRVVFRIVDIGSYLSKSKRQGLMNWIYGYKHYNTNKEFISTLVNFKNFTHVTIK